MDNEEIYKKAKKKVKAKKSFLYHLIAYLGVLAMLYVIISSEGENILPVFIVGLSWGIGLATHYLKAFGTQHLDFLGFDPTWEEDELENEIERLKYKRELKERIIEEQDLLEETERLELKQIEKRKMGRDLDL